MSTEVARMYQPGRPVRNSDDACAEQFWTTRGRRGRRQLRVRRDRTSSVSADVGVTSRDNEAASPVAASFFCLRYRAPSLDTVSRRHLRSDCHSTFLLISRGRQPDTESWLRMLHLRLIPGRFLPGRL